MSLQPSRARQKAASDALSPMVKGMKRGSAMFSVFNRVFLTVEVCLIAAIFGIT